MKNALRSVLVGLSLAAAMTAWPGSARAQMDGAGPASAKPQELPAGVAASEAPANARTLAEIRAAVKPGDAAVVRARVSAAKDAFAKGRAEFRIEDLAEPAPGATRETATVRLADASGATLKLDLRNRGGLAAGAVVTLAGAVLEVEAGKPMVLRADKIFVAPPDLPDGFFLSAVPDGSRPVEEVKSAAKKGDRVAIRGRIGGSEHPFVDGRAVFTIVGPGLKACSDHEDDHCKIPWDYCCETKADIALHSATIQVVDAAGKPLKLELKGRGGLKELSDITVVGKVLSAEAKAMVIQGESLYIHPKSK